MKLIIRGPDDLSILTDSGEDVTQALQVTEVVVRMAAHEYPTVELRCENWQVEASVRPDDVVATVNKLTLQKLD